MAGARGAAFGHVVGAHRPRLPGRAFGRWAPAGQRRVGRDGPTLGGEQRRLFAHPAERSPIRTYEHNRYDRNHLRAARCAAGSWSSRSPGSAIGLRLGGVRLSTLLLVEFVAQKFGVMYGRLIAAP